MTEILFYAPFYSDYIEDLITKINAIDEGEDITIRINSPGGGVFSGQGLFEVIQRRGIKIQVDGHAASMGAWMLLYAKEVTCLSTSKFMFHAASGYISNEGQRKVLNEINSHIKDAMKAKFDGDQFTKSTGLSIDDLFNNADTEEPKEVWLNAKQAKKLKLVSKVIELDAGISATIKNRFIGVYNDQTQEITDVTACIEGIKSIFTEFKNS